MSPKPKTEEGWSGVFRPFVHDAFETKRQKAEAQEAEDRALAQEAGLKAAVLATKLERTRRAAAGGHGKKGRMGPVARAVEWVHDEWEADNPIMVIEAFHRLLPPDASQRRTAPEWDEVFEGLSAQEGAAENFPISLTDFDPDEGAFYYRERAGQDPKPMTLGNIKTTFSKLYGKHSSKVTNTRI